MALALGLSFVPCLLDRAAVPQAAQLFHRAAGAHPYWQPDAAALLYLRAPLAALSAFALCTAPGLLLAIALRGAASLAHWILAAFGLNLVLLSLVSGVAQALHPAPITGAAFTAIPLTLAFGCFVAAWWRLGDGRASLPPLDRPAGGTLILSIAILWAAMALLTPKIYWESFGPDGHQVFETSRRLFFQPVPFWPVESGESSFPGFTTMLFAFPGAWFVRLFGDCEAAARLPLFLYLAIVFFGTLATLPRRLPLRAQALLWLALCVFLMVGVYSMTYTPYHADTASPVLQDTLFVACFLGLLTGFSAAQPAWIVLWTCAVYTCWPSGLMLAVFWSASALYFWKDRPWHAARWTLGTLAACVVAARFLGLLLPRLGLPAGGSEHGWLALVEETIHVYQIGAWLRLHFLWHPIYLQRWLWVLLPAGILPCAALVLWHRQDPWSRALTTTLGLYFAFFYLRAFGHIHYFVPVMLLPLAVYWRTFEHPRYLLTAAGIVAAAVLSWPHSARPFTITRIIGSEIDSRLTGYDRQDPRLFQRMRIFETAIPTAWAPGIPEKGFGILPSEWVFYANRGRLPGIRANYVIQLATDPPVPGATLLASRNGASLYVLSPAVLEHDRHWIVPDRPGSPLYQAPRWTMIKKREPLAETLAEIRRRLGLGR